MKGFLMNIPYARWYEAIGKRRSYRTYDKNRTIEAEKLAALDAVCREFRPFEDVRVCLVNKPVEDIFKFIAGNYGIIRNAPAFLAFIGNVENPYVNEQAGYTGEGVILEATALGLNNCWVGNAFSSKKAGTLVEMNDDERLIAVSPLGYAVKSQSFKDKVMTGFGRTHKRLPAKNLISGLSYEKSPKWVKDAIEAARLAPSAVNRQPWGFDIEEDAITVYIRSKGTDTGIPFRLDCGIAMLHLEIAALNAGYKGKWEFLQSPQVARFSVG
jgi:nitroreductase